ncbi:MAG TPA: PAS domain S-box protein [Candidatus Limnocylindrales bacterium]|nr:PAS domain S-box protein [Candidatus Limnocylindrales bacterium]
MGHRVVERQDAVIGSITDDDQLRPILEAVDAGITVQDSRLALVYANQSAAELCGWANPEEMLSASVEATLDRFEMRDESGAPLDPGRLPGRRALAGDHPDPMLVGFRDRRTNVLRWSLVRARLITSGTNEPLVVSTFHEMTTQVEAGQASIAGERHYREIVEALPVAAWVAAPDGSLTAANGRWYAYTGEIAATGPYPAPDQLHAEDRPEFAAAWDVARSREEALDTTVRLRRGDGAHRWHVVRVVPLCREAGALEGWIGTATDIDEERTTRARATDLARLVADAGLRLDESTTLAETIDAAAALALPELADWCVIDLVEPDGSLQRVAAVAHDPDAQATLDPIREFPTSVGSNRPAARAVRTRNPVLVADLADEEQLHRATGGIGELATIVRAMRARSVIVQPLVARGEAIGAMFFVVGPDRSYAPEDVDVTSELARRVALAISNAQIHAGEREARKAAEAAAERLERLQRVTRQLSQESTRDGVVNLVVREGRLAFGASGAVVTILGGDVLSVVASDGYDDAVIDSFNPIPIGSRLPLATAARTARPVWMADIQDVEADDERGGAIIARSPNRSACAVPLIADAITFGALGFSFAETREFDELDRNHIGAYADLCSQALARVALTGITERLVGDLEAERARLEQIFEQAPEGLEIADAPSGRIVLVNDRLEEILGTPRATLLSKLAGSEAHRGFDENGVELAPENWPLARAVRGEDVPYQEIQIVRADGSRTWVAKRAGPVRGRDGEVVAGVATMIDISAQRHARENRRVLSSASEILGSSLDYEDTIRRVADMAVPTVADWIAVDILDDKGVPQRVAVAHEDPAKVELAVELAARYAAPADAPRGGAFVIRTGRPDYEFNVTDEMIEAIARDEEMLELVKSLGLRSWVCVPILAAEQVLGTISLVAAESGRHFGPDDVAFAENLAARVALAISNATAFREAVRYKRVLDATRDAVIVFDPVSLRILYANQGVTDQLGYAEADLVGQEATMVLEDLDAIGLRGLVEPLVNGSLGSRTATLAYRDRAGRALPVEVLLQHVTAAGEPGRIVAVARDVADRIEAQANLRRMAESEHARAAELNAVIRAMGEGIFVCAADGRIHLANPAAEAMFPDVEEESYAEILAQMEDPEHGAPALGTVGGPVELRARGDDDRWIEVSTYPVAREEAEDPSGNPETIVMLRDITAARQAQAIRDTFIGVLSHELRTPVTTIYAGSKVLSRDGDQLPEATRREIFSDMVIESERLHRLVEDVIAMTRFGEDEGDVGTEPVLVQRILPAVIKSEKPRWPGVTFELAMRPGLPTAIADPTYVEQVIRNLLSNAAKYGGPGTTVRVAVDADADEVMVTVTDDGPGFPAEEADRVFDLFFRSQRTAAAASGAGIGLFVCARLIRAMGGRIWAKPGQTGGAEFGFTLRVMTDEA